MNAQTNYSDVEDARASRSARLPNTWTKIRYVLLVVSAIVGLTVIYYGVVYQHPLPDHPVLRGKNDLFLHAVAFLALSVPLLLLWPWKPIVAGLMALGIAIEAVQFWLPRRTPGWDDIVASVAGILIGGLIVLTLRAVGFRRK